MKRMSLIILCLLVASSASAATLKIPAASEIELETGEAKVPFHLSAGLLLPEKVRTAVHVVKTSPFDKMKYPIGEYTVDVFVRNLPQIFTEVIEVDKTKATDVDLVVEVAIVRFEGNIPHPASNPYTATMVYKITVKDAGGETVLVQTVTGEGQTSKGMMSGFKAKQLAAESAARAMADAARQALSSARDRP
jgi:hypothetical protein